jgi:hypothetical protein
MSTKESNRIQLRNLAIIFAGVSYALACLFFLGDAITDWGSNLYYQDSTGNVVILTFADFVGGVGMSTNTVSWFIGCMLVGVALTVTAIWNNRKISKA